MTKQSLKEQATKAIQNIVGRELTNMEQSDVDELFTQLIGAQDSLQDELPKTWTPDQKKYYVNFRNTLRREMNIKYWYGMK